MRGSITPIEPLLPSDAIHPLAHILRDRGVPDLREIHAIGLNHVPAEVMPLLQPDVVVKAEDWESAIQTQPMGFLSRLYCLGWKNGSLQTLFQV